MKLIQNTSSGADRKSYIEKLISSKNNQKLKIPVKKLMVCWLIKFDEEDTPKIAKHRIEKTPWYEQGLQQSNRK